MTVQQAYIQLKAALEPLYDAHEGATIAGRVMEHFTGFTHSQRLLHKNELLPADQEKEWRQATEQLQTGMPLQYVLKEAYFFGLKLYVDEHVLIPRPETEELVAWLCSDVARRQLASASFLDIGTGSGCIPIAIKKQLPGAVVLAIDVSEKALAVALRNADANKATVFFEQKNMLDTRQWHSLPLFDYIVSNPPYIAQSEANCMHANVVNHEPHLALFVPDNNPLLFYDAISNFGIEHLQKNGRLFFEINEAYGSNVVLLLQKKGYVQIELRKDLQGKDRLIKAEKR